MLLGYKTPKICNILKIESSQFEVVKASLIKSKKISKDEIKSAIDEKEKRDMNTIYELYKAGNIYQDIANAIPYCNKTFVERAIRRLKEEGVITEETVHERETAIFEREEKYKKEIILEGLQQGLFFEEIAENYKQKVKEIETVRYKTIDINTIIDYKVKLIIEGAITEEEFIEAREKRKQRREKEKKEQHVGPNDEEVLKLSKLGFDISQIIKIIVLSIYSITYIRMELKEKGKITAKEIRSAKKDREENAEKRTNYIRGMIGYTRNIDAKLVGKHIEYLKAKFKLGELTDYDIKLIRRVIPIDASLTTPTNVNFILTNLSRSGNYKQAMKFIDECMLAVGEDSKEYEKLKAAKMELKKKMLNICPKSVSKKNANPIGECKMPIQEDKHLPEVGTSDDGWEH